MRAQNDFHFIDMPWSITIPGGNDLPGWAIALIVIGSLLVAAAIGYFLYIKLVKSKNTIAETEGEKSLL